MKSLRERKVRVARNEVLRLVSAYLRALCHGRFRQSDKLLKAAERAKSRWDDAICAM